MTRERVKELLPILQAFVEGRPIQGFYNNNWKDIRETEDIDIIYFKYRIKPVPKYRPFKNYEECWEEMQKHVPFGWVTRKNDTYHAHIDAITNDPLKREPYNRLELYINNTSYSFPETFDDYTFIDGTPFGIKEKEELT